MSNKIWQSSEYLGRVRLTKNDLAAAINAQQEMYDGIRSTSSEQVMNDVLQPIGVYFITKLFRVPTIGVDAYAVYLVWSTMDRYLRTLTADVLNAGNRLLSKLNEQWTNPNWLEVEIEIGLLEHEMYTGDKIRYFMGNASKPEEGYRVTAVRTSLGWIPM